MNSPPPDDTSGDAGPDQLNQLKERLAAVAALEQFLDLTRDSDPATGSAPAANAAGEYRPPAEVGGHRVLKVLGRGGMGVVLLAEDAHLRRQVALKLMLPEYAINPAAKERFLREARAAAAVEHDHIVTIHQVGEDRGTPFIVMPVLRGETLADRLRREKRLVPAEVIRIGREVALGLAAAHAAGLIHRDIKPSNLWLEQGTGRVKVLDFGLARPDDSAEQVTRSGVVLGTPAYMAPEQGASEKLDARADLFSLGCVLYEAATGIRAFDAPSILDIFRKLATFDPPPPAALTPTVPPGLSALIVALLAKNPAGRPRSASVVAEELSALDLLAPAAGQSGDSNGSSADSTVGPDSKTQSPALPSPARRLRWTRRAILFPVLLVVVATGLVVWSASRPGGGQVPTAPGEPTNGSASLPVEEAPIRGSVDLLVYRVDGKGSDVLVPLENPLAMPLHTGDSFKIVATVDRPAFLYLFWVDEQGAGVPVYPWRAGEWGTRPAVEKPVPGLELVSPNGKGFTVTGDTNGMETIVMLARSARLTESEEEVRNWFGGLNPLPFRGDQARVWFENFDIVRTDARRGFKIAGDETATDGPFGLQATLKQRIGKSAGFERAISFARVAPKK